MLTIAKVFTVVAGLSGMSAVILGAFAAHALKERLSPALLETFQTGVHYQMIHAVVLLYVGLMLRSQLATSLVVAGGFYILGTLMFSGSLYGLALSGPRWLGPVTPLGGLCFIVGWLCLVIAAIKS